MAVRTFVDDFTTAWDVFDDRGAHVLQNPADQGTRMCWYQFNHTQGATLGDIGSTQGLLKIPPGPFRFLYMRVYFSNWGAARTVDIGWQAGTQADGTAITADPDGLAAALVASAVTAGGLDFNVQTAYTMLNPVTHIGIISTVAGGTIPVGATLKGHIVVGRP